MRAFDSRTSALVSAGLITVLVSAGLAWHSCVLIAAAALVAHRSFLWRLDLAAPFEAWRAGTRCLFAGIAGLAATLGLGITLVVAVAANWSMEPGVQPPVMALLLIAAGWLWAVQIGQHRRRDELRVWAAVLALALLSMGGQTAGDLLDSCLVSAAILAYLGWASWSLAGPAAGAFMRWGQRW